MTQPGQTPATPDVDQPQGGDGDHDGQTPGAPDVDQPEGGDHSGNDD